MEVAICLWSSVCARCVGVMLALRWMTILLASSLGRREGRCHLPVSFVAKRLWYECRNGECECVVAEHGLCVRASWFCRRLLLANDTQAKKLVVAALCPVELDTGSSRGTSTKEKAYSATAVQKRRGTRGKATKTHFQLHLRSKEEGWGGYQRNTHTHTHTHTHPYPHTQ